MTSTLRQLIRFGVVGLASNLLGFVWYLLATWLGVGPKIAMSLLFLIGTLQTFIFNKRWSFEHRGPSRSVFMRYLTVYLFGYLFNLLMLVIFVDIAKYSHVAVQGTMILVVAAMMFILQKFWVFPMPPSSLSEIKNDNSI